MGVECSFERWVQFTYVGLRKENNSGSERNMSKLRQGQVFYKGGGNREICMGTPKGMC